jgi:hypothetical protein
MPPVAKVVKTVDTVFQANARLKFLRLQMEAYHNGDPRCLSSSSLDVGFLSN